jgi:hypothetical protein
MENFANKVRDKLPMLLRDIVDKSVSAEDADMLLAGAMATMSATLPNVYGVYDRRRVYPNLYLFVSAEASVGKGRLALCKELVKPIHRELRTQYLVEVEMIKKALEEKGKRTDGIEIRVPQKALFLPANASSTAVYQTLNDNGGRGLIFETEGDTLANMLKQDYGNFSDGLRKAFHHEMVSYMRRKEREWVEIEEPQLSVVLAGTPRQIEALMPNVENGLFSRFLLLRLALREEWKDVFAKEVGCESDDEVFAEFGRRFFRFYRHLCDLDDEVQFVLTRKQEQAFNSRFGALQSEMISGEGYDMVASVRRLGLITFRLAMILSVLRLEGEVIESSRQLICADEDFGVAMTLMEALVEHSLAVYHELDSASSATVQGCKDVKNECKCQFIAELSDDFSNRDAELIGVKLNFSRRTVYSYLSELQSEGTIERVKLGKYRKRVQITEYR